MSKHIFVLVLSAMTAWSALPAGAMATGCPKCRPHAAPLEPKEANFQKQSAQFRRYMSVAVTASLGVGVVLGLGKVYFVWQRWRTDYGRERPPWDRTV